MRYSLLKRKYLRSDQSIIINFGCRDKHKTQKHTMNIYFLQIPCHQIDLWIITVVLIDEQQGF